MGRVGRSLPKVQITSRLTWTFSARAGLGRSFPVRSRRTLPASAATRLASAALMRSVLRRTRPRALPPTPHGLRRRRRG
ncbi:hypothetical protein EJC51_41715 [Streptomyces aquilus]|uniref:Uncharacterized protein n=1 Tax=Streptomyces aquilus TaxID=2548456 RepID=A0A3Q9C8E5_9ACTN|nr:hypothetical protein EJC51_41715 [Streptomyces aquilus]